jgi:microcystin-dependent protein
MSNPYVGEIRMFAGNFAPAGWAFCDGAPMAISENDTLFNVIGTTYGGDGQTTFNLPNLSSRFPMHQGNNHVIGEQGGSEEAALSVNQIPGHFHSANCVNAAGNQQDPTGHVWAGAQLGVNLFSNVSPAIAMHVNLISPTGGSQPHDNMSPLLVISFIISLFGVYPAPA